MRRILWLSIVAAVLIGCSEGKSPSQVYDEYNSRVINGISYADDKAYYSTRKQEEIASSFPRYMQQMDKTRDEVIAFYLTFAQEVAKCKRISLVHEVITGDVADLEYSQKDICGNESTTQEKQKIRMIKEDGWKIDDIEISL